MLYEKIIRPIVFKITDAEKIHHAVIRSLGFASRQKPIFNTVYNWLSPQNEILETKLGNLKLKGPVGLAAGFDKYIDAPLAYPMLGFGFAELGSITYSEQPGNPKPRLWRLPKDKGIIVYYGLSNAGAEKTARELEKLSTHPIPYGVSIAPTTGLTLDQMADDYVKSFRRLHQYADYITLNVSCPNVASADTFSQISFIEELAEKADRTRKELGINKDIFFKIGPHYNKEEIKTVVATCLKNNITGLIATNLIKNRSTIKPLSSEKELNHPGGISGKLLQPYSDETIRSIYKESNGKLKIIGVGGIFSAEDAYHKIKLGASAVQLITGFIYGGPLAIKKINDRLIELVKKDGFKNISEAVGRDA